MLAFLHFCLRLVYIQHRNRILDNESIRNLVKVMLMVMLMQYLSFKRNMDLVEIGCASAIKFLRDRILNLVWLTRVQ